MSVSDLARHASSTRLGRLPGPIASRIILTTLLGRLRGDALLVREGHSARCFGDPGARLVELTVHDPAAWSAVVGEGSVGLGRGFINGWWETPDPVGVLRILTRNLEGFDRIHARLDTLLRPVVEPTRRRRPPDHDRDRDNVRAHYDLSNDFFELMLDPTMMYSCGLFESAEATLEQASVAKIDRLCQLLELGPEDHLLEIGTGWGGLAVHAASVYGCRVTTTTISAEQFDYSRKRVAEAGLADLVEVADIDYRMLDGAYDKLVSVEMIEAVDWRDYDLFFGACSRLLRSGGLMALQAITIPDDRFDLRKDRTDFVKHYIFPGGCVPSVSAMCESMQRVSELRVRSVDEIGPDYARTLRAWRDNLAGETAALRALGLDERFERMWEFYLSFCEAGFAEEHIGDVQMVLEHRGRRRPDR